MLVNLVMAEAVERVRATADQRAISITLVEPEPPVAVLGDRRQLVSAMHALLENAVTYSYDGSTVTVLGTVLREGPDATGEPTGTTPAAVAAASVAWDSRWPGDHRGNRGDGDYRRHGAVSGLAGLFDDSPGPDRRSAHRGRADRIRQARPVVPGRSPGQRPPIGGRSRDRHPGPRPRPDLRALLPGRPRPQP